MIGRHGVNTAWLTSSLFNMITEEDIDVFAGLTQLMIGASGCRNATSRRSWRPTLTWL